MTRRDDPSRVALLSLLWAVLLTAAKLITGIISGSLGVLSEAIHSGLDLVAAGMTLFAVTQSAKPPDDDHQFGHGKFENLSALIETLLLVVTAVWIVWEAADRFATEQVPDLDFWPFAVMLFSIVVNIERARVLRRSARRHGSQALEADALHFWADAVSSVAVLAGLGATALGVWWADPLAALAVAAVIFAAALRLTRESVNALLDRAPVGAVQAIRRRIKAVDGVHGRPSVRVRPQGPTLHVDVVVHVEGHRSVQQAHDLATEVENTVRETYPGADVNVHVEPLPPVEEAVRRIGVSRHRRRPDEENK